jgi:hypothetical protein
MFAATPQTRLTALPAERFYPHGQLTNSTPSVGSDLFSLELSIGISVFLGR